MLSDPNHLRPLMDARASETQAEISVRAMPVHRRSRSAEIVVIVICMQRCASGGSAASLRLMWIEWRFVEILFVVIRVCLSGSWWGLRDLDRD